MNTNMTPAEQHILDTIEKYKSEPPTTAEILADEREHARIIKQCDARAVKATQPWWKRIRLSFVVLIAFIAAVTTATLYAPTFVYDFRGNQIGYSPLPAGETYIIVVPTWTPRPTPIPVGTPRPIYRP